MILSTHFITGAAVASYTDSPLLIILLPLILHFLLDVIPHWEYVDEVEELKKKIPHIAIDIISGPIVVFLLTFLIWGVDLKMISWLFIGGIVSVIPDGLSLLHILFPKNYLFKKVFAFHMAIHNKETLNWKIGFAFQIVLDILAISIIALPKV